MPEHGGESTVGVLRIDANIGDLIAVFQARVGPGLAAIGGFVDAIADGEIGALKALARADIDRLGAALRHRQAPDTSGWLVVEDRLPGVAVVGRLPDSAVVHADEKHVRLRDNPVRADGSPASKRPDAAPFQAVVASRGNLSASNRGERQRRHEKKNPSDHAAIMTHVPEVLFG